MYRKKLALLTLHLGLAFALFSTAVALFIYPVTFSVYFPGILHAHFSTNSLTTFFALLELVMALWILSGQRIFIPSLVTAILFGTIVLVNIATIKSVFILVPIIALALSLAIWNFPRHE